MEQGAGPDGLRAGRRRWPTARRRAMAGRIGLRIKSTGTVHRHDGFASCSRRIPCARTGPPRVSGATRCPRSRSTGQGPIRSPAIHTFPFLASDDMAMLTSVSAYVQQSRPRIVRAVGRSDTPGGLRILRVAAFRTHARSTAWSRAHHPSGPWPIRRAEIRPTSRSSAPPRRARTAGRPS